MSRVASLTPTTEGMPNSRAMIAPCDSIPPRSMTRPEMSGKIGAQPGSVWRVTRTSPLASRCDSVTSSRIAAFAVVLPPQAPTPVSCASGCSIPLAPGCAAGRKYSPTGDRHRVRRSGLTQFGVSGLGDVDESCQMVREHRAAGSEQFELVRGQIEDIVAAGYAPRGGEPSPIARATRRRRL